MHPYAIAILILVPLVVVVVIVWPDEAGRRNWRRR